MLKSNEYKQVEFEKRKEEGNEKIRNEAKALGMDESEYRFKKFFQFK